MKCIHKDLTAYILVSATPVVVLTIILASLITSCGSDSGSGSAEATDQVNQENAPDGESEALNSISVAMAAKLPECNEANDTQLAYARAEKTYYFCDSGSWSALDTVGENGKDGQNGVTTVIEQEATNKKNLWVDPISGKQWLIGGGGNYAQAVAACTGSYRLPTWAEASEAINHGIRGIAASIPQGQNFWIDTATPANPWYATETASVPNKFQVAATAGYAVYCIK